MNKHIRESIFQKLREIRSSNTEASLLFYHASLCGFLGGIYVLEGMSFNDHSRLNEINRSTFKVRSGELYMRKEAA